MLHATRRCGEGVCKKELDLSWVGVGGGRMMEWDRVCVRAWVWRSMWNRIHFVRVWMDSFDAVEDRFVIRVDSLVDILSLPLETEAEGIGGAAALSADMTIL